MVKRLGFTIIELIVTLVIMGLITLAVYPFLQSAIGRSELKRSTWEVADTIRRAQVQSMAGLMNDVWGVRIETNGYTLFKGSVFNPAEPENISFVFSSQITVSSLNLNGGVSDLLFASTGRTDAYGTITLQDASTTLTSTITVTEAGKITHD